ncbi:type VI secretion system baseplate subunit TssF [Marivita sp. XM-24bin2]|uniref:type VI secretion system baseplate subunit TssF n=1 Tax=unclassified Marivita TaxID=2632480 RepID=UPI000D78D2AC|nr:type VI secretion system baseplate subunit TssF [Marivita sp. XM-24bin2]MCR9108567.1 type VI secretion system baseplate subunit TssF [Paracoccaceae bacterium]PWL36133.1 MAG: type VI secretion system baseplate subunit TssF [Marivita sp. XM-24bin2]
MDTRLLRHYETELAFLREMGAEFAKSYPKIASRLGMDGLEILDPYVERLLEGTAFLTARVQLELELQYPAFTNHLLDVVFPHFLAPTPSMMIAELTPDMENADLVAGYTLPRHTVLRSKPVPGAQKPCQFRTASALDLWPITVTEAEYIDGRGALVAAGVARDPKARAAVRLRLTRHGGQPLKELPLDRLVFFLGGQVSTSWTLFEMLCAKPATVVARSVDRRDDWVVPLNAPVASRGLEPDEALLPTPRPSFDGYRLLQEYFAMPERNLFIEVSGLSAPLQRTTADSVDVYLLLRDNKSEIAPNVTPEAFKLHCVPAINLFPKRCDRVPLSHRRTEHHVVPDRTAPKDFEVFAITKVTGIRKEGKDDLPLKAFYSSDEFTAAGSGGAAYYTHTRHLRQRSESEALRGVRTNYLGSESYLSVVDGNEAPYPFDLGQLAVEAMVTNRDLPMLLPTGADDVFHLPDGGPVAKIRTLIGPTKPRTCIAQGDAAWRAVSHLSLNYLSISDETGAPGGGAAALRELIGLYTPVGDSAMERQLEGIVSVSTRPIVRRIHDGVLSTAVRGLEITLVLDESLFEGSSIYTLGSVLERFFRKYTTINSFTETVLKTQQRGEIARWSPKMGANRAI